MIGGGEKYFLCYIFLFPFSPHSELYFSYQVQNSEMWYGWNYWNIRSDVLKKKHQYFGVVRGKHVPFLDFKASRIIFLLLSYSTLSECFALYCKLLLWDLGCCLVLTVREGISIFNTSIFVP